jgi:hypothetical protein
MIKHPAMAAITAVVIRFVLPIANPPETMP